MNHAVLTRSGALLLSLGLAQSASGVGAAPSSGATGTIADYMLMNVCVDANDRAITGIPPRCPGGRQRDIRPGDLLYYRHADFPLPGAKGCAAAMQSQRFALPLRTAGSDERGRRYTLVAGWTDYPPVGQPCQYNRFDARDTATLLAIGPEGASLIGAHHHNSWFLTTGPAFADPRKAGASRFMGAWAFPAAIPAKGKVGWGIFGRRTVKSPRPDFAGAAGLAPGGQRTPTPSIQFWKRIDFQYGSKDRPTMTLDTILQIPFTRVGPTKDAPGGSQGSEHAYLTREYGFVTRWENWSAEDARKDVMGQARKAYTTPGCTKPATIAGQLTPHFHVGEIEDNPRERYYRQLIATSDGKTIIRKYWYMTGCHDFTNVAATKPFDPYRAMNDQVFGAPFLSHFQARK